jgi:hypothetical protein
MQQFAFESSTPALEATGTTNPVTSGGLPISEAPLTAHDSWSVQVVIQIKSSLGSSIAGVWHLTLFSESLSRGPGELKVQAQSEADIPAGPAERSFSWDLQVKPGQLPEGAYKLVTVAVFTPEDKRNPSISGYTEGPIIEIYDWLS